jgi:hypothetical protein
VEVIGIGRNQQQNSRFISMGTIKFASTSWRSLIRLTCNNCMALLLLLTILASNDNNINTSVQLTTIIGGTTTTFGIFSTFFSIVVVATPPTSKYSIGFCQAFIVSSYYTYVSSIPKLLKSYF